MPNPYIKNAITEIWRTAGGLKGNLALDLSCGSGDSSRILSSCGFQVVATDFSDPPDLGKSIHRVGGVDLNSQLPFRSGSFDAVNLIEVIEHIEHQAQLIREMARVLKEGGVAVISTPNVLNAFSRLRFLFTGFLRGRVRPLHYSFKPGNAHNVYLIHFYELYYLLLHSGFDIESVAKTRIKFASVFFGLFLYPLMWLFSFFAVVLPEKDPVQRNRNWRILRYFFSVPLLLSDNVVVKARKRRHRYDAVDAFGAAAPVERDSLYKDLYEEHYERFADENYQPTVRRSKRIETYCRFLGKGYDSVLELGCGFGDLSYSLLKSAKKVVATDISIRALSAAKRNGGSRSQQDTAGPRPFFAQINATELAFAGGAFDRVVSTSMIEHLDPEDIERHLSEVRRILKPQGLHLIWCPNGLGHHSDRDFHLSALSHEDLMNHLTRMGFTDFQTLMFNRFPFVVNARVKVHLERFLTRFKIRVLWSHLGVRNILLLARKA